MATKLEDRRPDLYQDDFYVWSQEQATLLRAGRFSELDLENLIEEVEDLGKALERSARSRLRTIIEHLLKLEYSPASDPKAQWRRTVLTQRDDVLDELTPTLGRIVEAKLPKLYDGARRVAERSFRDHGEDEAADRLPTTCPYTLDQLLGSWLP